MQRITPKKYCVAMDNLFTTSTAIKNLRGCGVGVVGTARARRGWPPKEIKDKSSKNPDGVDDMHFNSLHYTHDKDNYLIARWVDNNVVKMVSTIHQPHDTVMKKRRRPRITNTNKNNVGAVWKGAHTVEIQIPKIIDDYNTWMCGVDVCDQLIAYYNPNLRNRRTWLPMFFHCLNVSRVNSYLVHQNLSASPVSHKEFVLQIIEGLMSRVDESYRSRLKRAAEANRTPPVKRKRARLSHKSPELPDRRFEGDRADHVAMVPSDKKSNKCKMCSFEALMVKKRNKQKEQDGEEGLEDVPKIRRTTKICGHCSSSSIRVYLCEDHFNAYHES